MNIDPIRAGLLVTIYAGVLGAVLGSFLNVCIVRWGAEPKQSVMHPRSRCPRCGAGIAWYDNIPVLSWLLLLRGRCRGCGLPISIHYPLVELATGLVWAYMAWRFGGSIEAVRGALFGTLLIGITMTDARAYIIPDEFTIGGLVLGLAFSLVQGVPGLIDAVIGAAVGFGLLWGVALAGKAAFKQEAMGGGDIKMMAMVGAFLGWQGVLLTIFLGALLGSLIFVPMSLAGNKKLVPFGIFLSLGAAVAYIAGADLYTWYLSYINGV